MTATPTVTPPTAAVAPPRPTDPDHAAGSSGPARPAPQHSSAPLPAPEQLTVVKARHPWRWVGIAAVLVLLAQVVNGFVTNPGWDWPTFGAYFASATVLKALWVTVQLTLLGTALGFVLGTVLAAMRLSHSSFLRIVAWSYVWVFRSIPLIVQLLFWFNIGYLYKTLQLGVPFGPGFLTVHTNSLFGPMGAAVMGLALHQAAYAAEIIRGGIVSVDAGQLEAAAALGLPRRRQFFRIVLPQAMRSILPNGANEVISLFKGTSIVSVMAIPELFYQVQVIYGRNGRVVPLLMVATVWYIILTTALSILQHYLERRFGRGSQRKVSQSPLQRLRSAAAGR